MAYRQDRHSNGHHRAVENHEQNLVICEGASEALTQFCDAEAAPGEDGDCGYRNGYGQSEGLAAKPSTILSEKLILTHRSRRL